MVGAEAQLSVCGRLGFFCLLTKESWQTTPAKETKVMIRAVQALAIIFALSEVALAVSLLVAYEMHLF